MTSSYEEIKAAIDKFNYITTTIILMNYGDILDTFPKYDESYWFVSFYDTIKRGEAIIIKKDSEDKKMWYDWCLKHPDRIIKGSKKPKRKEIEL